MKLTELLNKYGLDKFDQRGIDAAFQSEYRKSKAQELYRKGLAKYKAVTNLKKKFGIT